MPTTIECFHEEGLDPWSQQDLRNARKEVRPSALKAFQSALGVPSEPALLPAFRYLLAVMSSDMLKGPSLTREGAVHACSFLLPFSPVSAAGSHCLCSRCAAKMSLELGLGGTDKFGG